MYSHAEKSRIAQARSATSPYASTSWQFAGRHSEAAGADLLQSHAQNGPQSDSLRTLQAKADTSPGVTKAIQLATLASSLAVQRQEEDQAEPVQGRFAALQRQSSEEEEPLQGKFAPIQRAGSEEEEPLQGRFTPVQRQQADEDEVQMKAADSSASSVQRRSNATATKNETGLPDNLKAGIESLSGFSMDSVRVHYNSSQPAQLNALAYAQGTDIHVAPGQERHLPHEAWHVVQQAQGRVKPTMQMKGGVPVNDDQGLEREADAMGSAAISMKVDMAHKKDAIPLNSGSNKVQQQHAAKFIPESAQKHYTDGWGGGYKITNDKALKAKVPNSVTGAGDIPLGRFYAPMREQNPKDRRFAKDCHISYEDGKKENETKIYHCGPSGQKYWYDWPKSE